MEILKRRRAMICGAKKKIVSPLYIYKSGDTTWQNVLEATYYIANPVVTFGKRLVSIEPSAGAAANEAVVLKVDFTNYSKLYIKSIASGSDSGPFVGYGSKSSFTVKSDVSTTKETTISYDIGNRSGTYYIRLKPSSGGCILDVREIRLEV